MLKFTLRVWPVVAILSSQALVSVDAQTSAVTTNTPSTNAPAATQPAAIALGDIVSQAQIDTTKLQADQADLNTDQALQTANEKLATVTGEIMTAPPKTPNSSAPIPR